MPEDMPIQIGSSSSEELPEAGKAKTIIIQNVETLNLYVTQCSMGDELKESLKELISLAKNLMQIIIEHSAKHQGEHSQKLEERKGKQHHETKHEKKGAPSIQTLNELLSFTKGDRKYARNIVRKRKLIGVEYGDVVYAVDPELIDQLKSGATAPEELPKEYHEVAKAIAEGRARLIKNVQLQNMI